MKIADSEKGMILPLPHIVELLSSGEVIAFPTETFFGLAAFPGSEKGVKKLLDLKGRELEAGIPIIIDSKERVEQWIADEQESINKKRRELQDTFWPGALTLVIATNEEAKNFFQQGVLGPERSLALRLSSSPLALALASALGGPITATSANYRGHPPAVTVSQVRNYFPEMFVLEEQSTPRDSTGSKETQQTDILPSTILDVRKFPFQILREGAISQQLLLPFLG